MKLHLCLLLALFANAELKRHERELKENIIQHLSDPVLLNSIADLLLLKIADKNIRFELKTNLALVRKRSSPVHFSLQKDMAFLTQ